MKNQIFTLVYGLIILFLIAGIFFFMLFFNKIYVDRYLIPSQKEQSLTMLNSVIENYLISNTNLTIKQAIIYIATQKNEILNGINLTEEIKTVLDKILEKRWRLLVEETIIIDAWIVKVNFYEAEPWNYDTSIYPDFEDNLGYKWYQSSFNDSSWIHSAIPFYQGSQIENLLKISKNMDLNDLFPEIFTKRGIYVLNSKISPLNFLRIFEACYYPGDSYKPSIYIEKDISKLPKEIDIGEFAYYNISNDFCNNINNYKELRSYVFKIEKEYSSISNISEMIQGSNIGIAVSYVRGHFYVPNECKEIYVEAIWNELFRIYINGIFLFATCYNSNLNPPKYKLPDAFCIENSKFPCIKGIPTWGILKINITNYVKKEEFNTLAMLFGVPHDKQTIPPCFKDIIKYSDISLNTLGSVRIFCIDDFGEIIELNDKTKLPPKILYELGYNIPNNYKIYVLQLPIFSKEMTFGNVLKIFTIRLLYW